MNVDGGGDVGGVEQLSEWLNSPGYNPFKIPAHADMFALRDQERRASQIKRERERTAPVHEKHTHATRISHLTAQTRRFVLQDEEEGNKGQFDLSKDWTLETTKDHPFGKEGIVEYINRKREMFLVKYAISVKREEMRKLEKLARDEEQKLVIAEKCLEDDAVTFDLFLKENDKSSVEAIRQAEVEMRKKLDKVNEVKRLSNVIRGIQTEISKQEERLIELKKYRGFIDELTPYPHKHSTKKAEKKKQKMKKAETSESQMSNKSGNMRRTSTAATKRSTKSNTSIRSSVELRKGSSKTQSRLNSGSKTSVISQEDEDLVESSDDEVELYFNGPNELLTLFNELEDQNLSLIQNGQDLEENIDEIKAQAKLTRERLGRDVNFLADQITMLEQSAIREEERIQDLSMKCEMFSFGEFDQDDQEKLLKKFGEKVGDVYGSVIGDNDANISTLQMLTSIENTLGTLLDMQETLPEDVIAEFEKKLEKDRRARLREEKIREQEALQKERVKRALERAQAAPRSQVGRKPVPRSEPPRVKEKKRKNKDQLSLEQQEYRYFFEY